VLNRFNNRRARLLCLPAAVVVGIVVLVCVPGLTRMGQKLETASHAPSFAKNIDCPPKRVTIVPVVAVASPAQLQSVDIAPVARFAPASDPTLPRSPYLSSPHSLRAPPAVPFA
jgi:hypothetical protein